ncbi:hypothetical protein JD79_04469, partial [Geodermatophilus normandii]
MVVFGNAASAVAAISSASCAATSGWVTPEVGSVTCWWTKRMSPSQVRRIGSDTGLVPSNRRPAAGTPSCSSAT